jgi:hypothetical protein
MNFLKIKNKGLIEIEALSLVGATTKADDESTIGMFGSGNKYAIAYFVRNNIDVKIYSGKEEIKITTKKVDFRSQNYDVIHFNNHKTSLTTNMGPKWKLWQAIREIYCNAIDEGEDLWEEVSSVNPVDDETHFYIPINNEILQIIEDKDDYFSFDKKILFENEYGRILKKHGPNTCIYRKGIKCYETTISSIYDYDFNNLDINEERICTNIYDIHTSIWQIIIECSNSNVINSIFNKIENPKYIESDFMSYSWSHNISKASESFKDYLKNNTVFTKDLGGYLKEEEKLSTIFLPSNLYEFLRGSFKNLIKVPESISGVNENYIYKYISPTPLMKDTLNKIKDFFKECFFDQNYPIKIARFSNKKVMGTINKEKEIIIVSEEAFKQGFHYVISTIIEENCHLSSGAKDETRHMQDALLDMMITQMKKQSAYNI